MKNTYPLHQALRDLDSAIERNVSEDRDSAIQEALEEVADILDDLLDRLRDLGR